MPSKIIETDTFLKITINETLVDYRKPIYDMTCLLKSSIIGFSFHEADDYINIIVYLNSGKEFNLGDEVGRRNGHDFKQFLKSSRGECILVDLIKCLNNILAPKKSVDLLDINHLPVA